MLKLITDPSEILIRYGDRQVQGNSLWRARVIFLFTMPISMLESSVKHCVTVCKTMTFILSGGRWAKDFEESQDNLSYQIDRTCQLFAFWLSNPELVYDMTRSTSYRRLTDVADQVEIMLAGKKYTFDKLGLKKTAYTAKLLVNIQKLQADKAPWYQRELLTRLTYLGVAFVGIGESIAKTTLVGYKWIKNPSGDFDALVNRIETQFLAANAAKMCYVGICGLFFNPKVG